MASEVGIVNSALHKIGATSITSLTEGSDNANVANDQYPVVRDDLLRSHNWNFATRRKKLARSATEPAFEFDHQYPVPSDFLRIVSVTDNDAGVGRTAYKFEFHEDDGNVILCSSDELWLRYIAQITDPNRMAADFREALSWALAREFAVAIANSGTLHNRMARQAERVYRRARSVDGVEDWPEQFPSGSWVESRFTPDTTPFSED